VSTPLPARDDDRAQSIDYYMAGLEILTGLCRSLALLPLDQMTDTNERMQTLGPILESTAYQRGGGQRLHEQRRVIDAARELQRWCCRSSRRASAVASLGVGPESDEYRAVCAYSGPSADVSASCQERAVRHLQVRTGQYGVVGLATCVAHLKVARLSAEVLLEHPHAGLCGLPGTVWLPEPDNACVLDATGVEPVYEGASVRCA
jgi:hypothetical protein